jgi:hypothetical protein
MGTTTDLHTKLPEPLRKSFDFLWQEIVGLHAEWNVYSDLFGEAKTIEILNRCAPTCFRVINLAIANNIIMTLRRLVDPPESRVGPTIRQNLSLAGLVQKAKAQCGTERHPPMHLALDEVRTHCRKAMKEFTDRVLAHYDEKTILHIDPVTPVLQQDIEEALRLVRALMNAIQSAFEEPPTSFEHVQTMDRGTHLVRMLERALKAVDEERSRYLGKMGTLLASACASGLCG